MSNLPQITEDVIESWTGSRSFLRGRAYAEGDNIVNPRAGNRRLRALREELKRAGL